MKVFATNTQAIYDKHPRSMSTSQCFLLKRMPNVSLTNLSIIEGREGGLNENWNLFYFRGTPPPSLHDTHHSFGYTVVPARQGTFNIIERLPLLNSVGRYSLKLVFSKTHVRFKSTSQLTMLPTLL